MDLGEDPLAVLQSAHPDVSAATGPEWLAEIGGVVEAIPYHWLYWPEVLESHGAIFIDLYGVGRPEYERRLSSALDGAAPGRTREQWVSLVDSFNYFEVSQIFRQWRGPLDASETAQLALADLLVAPWRARLQQAYPERQFRVAIAPPDPDLGVCIEAVQVSPSLDRPPGW